VSNLFKVLMVAFLMTTALFGIETVDKNEENKEVKEREELVEQKVFGHNLFDNHFELNNKYYNDPNYTIDVGDMISIKIWGAITAELELTVDKKGNIFLPELGVVSVIGKTNKELATTLNRLVKKTYKQNVYLYANIKTYQEVNIFVTGAVSSPGLYNGLSGDSVLRYLDLAGGIQPLSGSMRDIKILRKGILVAEYDLYDFLINGSVKKIQLKTGDVVLVGIIQGKFSVTGDVSNPYIYELNDKNTTLGYLKKMVGVYPNTNRFTVERKEGLETTFSVHSINENKFVFLSGDNVSFEQDHHTKNIKIKVDGEHDGAKSLIVEKGSNLAEVVSKIKTNRSSDMTNITIYRKSVAKLHKKMLNRELDDLEKQILTKTYMTEKESQAGQVETASILKFIERARSIKPKGLLTISDGTAHEDVLLEEGDEILIPHKSNVVLTQGEVSVPSAHTYVSDSDTYDYIAMSGGLSARASNNIIVIRANGKVVKQKTGIFSSNVKIKAGDSIVVFAKVDNNNIEIMKSISTILFNIAVATSVVLNIND